MDRSPSPDYARNVAPWRDERRTFAFFKGRVALHAILRAAEIGPGDQVLIPGYTCVVVPAAVNYTGAEPIYYDIDPQTLNGDPEAAARAVTPSTRAILIQHTYGVPADVDALTAIARKHDLLVIEDCAHAMGAAKAGRPAGTLGHAAFGSFQWSKPVTTGLGGLALVNDDELAGRLGSLYGSEYREPPFWRSVYMAVLALGHERFFGPRLFWRAQDTYRWLGRKGLVQGSSSHEELESSRQPEGYATTFGRPRARLLARALRRLPGILEHRRRIGAFYRNELAGRGLIAQRIEPGDEIVDLRVPLKVGNRDELIEAARDRRIELGDWFNAPLHPSGCNLSCFNYEAGDCPIADESAAATINLPTHTGVSLEEAARILEFVRSFSG